MNFKNRTPYYIAIIVVLLLVYWNKSHQSTTESTLPKSSISPSQLVYTKHARCRMDCRHVTEEEVYEIITGGRVNAAKSDPGDKPCPTRALEGRSSEGQLLRIVVADCDRSEKIITVIDLEHDFECDCK